MASIRSISYPRAWDITLAACITYAGHTGPTPNTLPPRSIQIPTRGGELARCTFMWSFWTCRFFTKYEFFHSTDSPFQIGVSAVFICNYAQTRLEVPRNPPLSQQDLLATALQPILSFVVLGSILIRMSSPFRFRGRLSMFAILQMAFPFRSFRWAAISLAR